MVDDATQRLRDALGATSPISLAVSIDGQSKPEYVDIDSPYALVGRGKACHVVLPDKRVSFRHAYLQSFGKRVLCVDLLSATGISWDGPDSNCWLTPAHRLQIGDSRVQLLDNGTEAIDVSLPSPLDCKTRQHENNAFGRLPDVRLELSNQKLKGTSWPINRVMTLLGRDSRCRITCGDDRVSRVHCSLLLTPAGLWVIDLLGRDGITVNGQRRPVALLSDGDELGVGQYRMKVVYETSPAVDGKLEPVPPPETTEFTVATALPETSSTETQTQVAQQSAARVLERSLPRAEFMTRNNRIFPVEFQGETLIVSPRGGIRTAPYQQMQLESNVITQLLTTRMHLKNVVVDVSHTDAMDSIVISCVSAICRSARHRAALCHCTDAMLAVLNDMSLTRIWPHFATREEAVTYVQS
jgi:pSer/pThr/pTyr-binding forkhead associated (FHA) protein